MEILFSLAYGFNKKKPHPFGRGFVSILYRVTETGVFRLKAHYPFRANRLTLVITEALPPRRFTEIDPIGSISDATRPLSVSAPWTPYLSLYPSQGGQF